MKKTVLSLASVLLFAWQAAAVNVADVCGKYKGDLNIGGDMYNSKEVYLLPGTTADAVTFVLPHFAYNNTELGNIVLTNIAFDSEGGLSLEAATLYLPAIKERAMIDIVPSVSEGDDTYATRVTATEATVLLRITVKSLPEPLLVFFAGNREQRNYTIPNGGFEDGWTNNEAAGWHSFASATGVFSATVSGNTHQFTQQDGFTGKGACITSNIIFGVKANGNMTNGQMNTGSMTATDGANNYNFSDPANTGFNTPFVGTPDALSFRVKYVPADRNAANSVNRARMHAAITTNARYQDPEEGGEFAAVRVAEAVKNYAATDDLGWQQITAPFVYNDALHKDEAAYILVTFTTNQTPGGGSSYSEGGLFNKTNYVDSCYIDDVTLVYDTRLASLEVDGRQLDISNEMGIADAYCDDCYTLTATPQGIGAQCFIGYDAAGERALIYVMGNDYEANPAGCRIYALRMGTTDLRAMEATPAATRKIMQGGKVYILRNGNLYDLLGNPAK